MNIGGNTSETARLVAFLAVVGILAKTGALGHTETVGLLTALLGYAFGQHSGEARANANKAAATQAAVAAASAENAATIARVHVEATTPAAVAEMLDKAKPVDDPPGKSEPRGVG